MSEGPIKTCGCGASYTRATWAALPWCGVVEDGEESIALRHCVCGSTIAVLLHDDLGPEPQIRKPRPRYAPISRRPSSDPPAAP